jgi:hypothetical protein
LGSKELAWVEKYQSAIRFSSSRGYEENIPYSRQNSRQIDLYKA